MMSEYFYFINSCKRKLGGLCCNFIYLHFGCEKWKETGDVYICILNMMVVFQFKKNIYIFGVWFTSLLLIIGYIHFFYIRNSSGFYFKIERLYDILSFHDVVLWFCAHYVRNIMVEVGSVPGDALIHDVS